MDAQTSKPALEAVELSKHFSGVQALDRVSLTVRSGQVLALMGENGAGKSTLLRIINGDHQPDGGELRLDGEPVSHAAPHDAHQAGVRVIAQEPEIVPHVDVAENIYLGALPHHGHVFSRAQAQEAVATDLEQFGFDGLVRPSTLGRHLSAAQRQVVEIMRGLVGTVRVLAFDEPTSSLSDHEVDILFALIDRLRADGVAIIYVSHRMKEIFRIADEIAVLRDGKLVGVRQADQTDEDELVHMMVGRNIEAMFHQVDRPVGDVVLDVDHVTTDAVADISLNVRAGEIVAVAGLVGAGRSELAKAIIGDLPIHEGRVSLHGKRLKLRSPADAVKAGIGFAPEERKTEALILGRSVRDNVVLAVLKRLRRGRFVSERAERVVAEEFITSLRIKTPSADHQMRKLSGGNQQKVVLARWLARDPALLILDEPTRGVDIGAKAEIYAIINRLAESGTALLIISSELPEVIGVADRILVMQDGRLTGELPRGAGEEEILDLAMNHPAIPDIEGAPA